MKNKIHKCDFLIVGAGLIGSIAALALHKNNFKVLVIDKEKKISAIGLRVKKWITYHGLSFNINPDLKYYNSIHSCGLKEYANTSLNELGIKIDQKEFDEGFKKILESRIEKDQLLNKIN